MANGKSNWINTGILSVLVVVVLAACAISWAARETGNDAMNAATKATTDLAQHVAVQTERDKHRTKQLNEMDTKLNKLLDK